MTTALLRWTAARKANVVRWPSSLPGEDDGFADEAWDEAVNRLTDVDPEDENEEGLDEDEEDLDEDEDEDDNNSS